MHNTANEPRDIHLRCLVRSTLHRVRGVAVTPPNTTVYNTTTPDVYNTVFAYAVIVLIIISITISVGIVRRRRRIKNRKLAAAPVGGGEEAMS
jgi:hypothetical protein